MEVPFAVMVGVLFASGLYLMMQRNLMRFVFGLLVLSGSVNVLIFTAGRLTRGAAPVIPAGLSTPAGEVANALPQAVVLTAIVIGFGLIVFTLVLLLRVYERLGTVKTDELGDALVRLDDEDEV
ncbi:MAG: cation:proton antiporter [Trueperaceae bacterium]|nr:MAG: cation:proton antiporter [Trueperaceae bacterium]